MTSKEPSRKQPPPSVMGELRKTSGAVADAFMQMRNIIAAGPIDSKCRELILVATCVASRNEGGLRTHCWRAADEGATREEIEQAILLNLGASQTLSPVVEALAWARETLDAYFD